MRDRASQRDRPAGRARSGSHRHPRHLRPACRARRETAMKRMTHKESAARVACDIPEGAYVNLGIGLPTLVANYLPQEREIFLHSENGLLGMGPGPDAR